MGALCNLVDVVLFVFFLIIGAAPLQDTQIFLPHHLLLGNIKSYSLHLFPPFLLEFKSRYTQKFGDYLFSEEPPFFVGLIWLELIFQWPFAVASLYAIAAEKSWLNTTCLIFGSSLLTTMVAILAEMKLSNRAPDKLLQMYLPFLGFAILALLRGLFGHSEKSVTIGTAFSANKKEGFKSDCALPQMAERVSSELYFLKQIFIADS